ncbi:PTS sugar transporter subunit IIA [Streptococcus castoreus]|uniref:PTS sugar transporter subunit IIA n=1 Tax=Streptococcus castoreus TaxID=254786 RepID=UPI00040ED355|nr:fructose PTS transporter subunit IIA [Streptococcus castoreus]
MEVTRKELINLELTEETKETVIQSLAKQIDACGLIESFDTYYDSVLEREALTSTGIGFGIAIPHGKSLAVKECAVAFGRLSQEVDWESLDNEPVKMVFLLAVPESCSGNQHLKIIASLSRKLIHEDFRTSLEKSKNSQEIVDLINDCLQNMMS